MRWFPSLEYITISVLIVADVLEVAYLRVELRMRRILFPGVRLAIYPAISLSVF